MRKALVIIISILVLLSLSASASAGDLPVNDYELIRKLLLQPDMDFSIFIGEQLCDALIYLVENDDNERVVHHALAVMWVTGDERCVPYLIENLDDEDVTMDCLYGLGYFSTVDSYGALAGYLDDENEFNRRFAVESLGNLDFTVSDKMWELRPDALALMNERLSTEEQEWILPIIEEGIRKVYEQKREDTVNLPGSE